jgi:ribonuclease D
MIKNFSSPTQRRTFEQLYEFRDSIARNEDESPTFVIPDKVLVDLS